MPQFLFLPFSYILRKPYGAMVSSADQKINRPLLYSGRSMKNLYLTFVTNFIFSVLFLLSAQLLLPLVLRLL